jgi:hypothetical protein
MDRQQINGNANRTPLILLVDPRAPGEPNPLSEWFELHSFSTYEAIDALDAIGFISDFTTEQMPDVVTIPRAADADGLTVSELLNDLVGGEASDLTVLLFSQEAKGSVSGSKRAGRPKI